MDISNWLRTWRCITIAIVAFATIALISSPLAFCDDNLLPDSIGKQQIASVHEKPILKRFTRKALFWNREYYFVAQNDADCEVFSGKVYDNLLTGKITFRFFLPDGSECSGAAVADAPLSDNGKMTASSQNGRRFAGEWTAKSFTTGFGIFVDNMGNHFHFTFGYSAKDAVKIVNAARRAMNCPDIDVVDGAQMEVQGRILRTQ